MSEFDWCRTGPFDLQGLGSGLFGERSPRPFLFCGSLLHRHKHFPVWMSRGCHVHRQQVSSHLFDGCHCSHAAWLLDERHCVILSMEHCCETSLLLQVRFKISRYGLLRFDTILSFYRFEADSRECLQNLLLVNGKSSLHSYSTDV